MALIGVTAIWGLTFVVIKNALGSISPFYFNAIRFSLAALLLLFFSLFTKQKYSVRLIIKGVLAGIALLAGYSFQTFGLNLTSASNAGFITGLSVVIVPVLTLIIYKKSPPLIVWFGVSLAAAGLGIMSLKSGFTFNPGDLIILLSAVGFALHMIIVGLYTNDFPTIPFVAVQIATVSAASWAIGALTEKLPPALSLDMWKALLYTALFATFIAYLVQNWAQKFTTPTRTALILAAEPVFTLIFATLLLKEMLTMQGAGGAALMLCGVLLVVFAHE